MLHMPHAMFLEMRGRTDSRAWQRLQNLLEHTPHHSCIVLLVRGLFRSGPLCKDPPLVVLRCQPSEPGCWEGAHQHLLMAVQPEVRGGLTAGVAELAAWMPGSQGAAQKYQQH